MTTPTPRQENIATARLNAILNAYGIKSAGPTAALYKDIVENKLSSYDSKIDLFEQLEKLADATPHIREGFHETEKLKTFFDRGNADYTDGTSFAAINYTNHAFAANPANNTAYVDPYHILNMAEPTEAFKTETAAQNQNVLLSGPIAVKKDTRNDLEKFLNAVKESQLPFKRVIIPIVLQAEGQSMGHAVSLVFDRDPATGTEKATISDNNGYNGSPFNDAHDYMKETLINLGIPEANIARNEYAVCSTGRDDCALFTSCVNQYAAQNPDTEVNTYPGVAADVDLQHGADKNLVKNEYLQMYRENPIFRLYLASKGVTDFESRSENEQINLTLEFRLPTGHDCESNDLYVDALDLPPEDERWKVPVRNILNETFRNYNRPYVETPVLHDNTVLNFREGNNCITFTSPHNANIVSDQLQDYIILCESAQRMGKNQITFGAFADNPELRSKLYLACLLTGMRMRNAPSVESLKDSPEYPQIYELDLKKRVTNINRDTADAKAKWENSPNRPALKQAVDDAKDQCKELLTHDLTDSSGALVPGGDQMRLKWQRYKRQTNLLAGRDTRGNPLRTPLNKTQRERVRKQMHQACKDIEELWKQDPYKPVFEAYQTAVENLKNDPDYQSYQQTKEQQQAILTEAVEYKLKDKDNADKVEELLTMQSPMLEQLSTETDPDFEKRQKYEYSELLTQGFAETNDEFNARKQAMTDRFNMAKNKLVNNTPTEKSNIPARDHLVSQVVKQLARNGRSPF